MPNAEGIPRGSYADSCNGCAMDAEGECDETRLDEMRLDEMGLHPTQTLMQVLTDANYAWNVCCACACVIVRVRREAADMHAVQALVDAGSELGSYRVVNPACVLHSRGMDRQQGWAAGWWWTPLLFQKCRRTIALQTQPQCHTRHCEKTGLF